MEIDRLLRKRQLNVQEQNAVTAYKIMKTARFWMGSGVPAALARFGESQGVSWSETIILKLEVDFPGMPRIFGLLLNQAEKFIAFEMDTDSAHQHVEFVSQWKDVSSDQKHAISQRGTGKSFAVLAKQVRLELLTEIPAVSRLQVGQKNI